MNEYVFTDAAKLKADRSQVGQAVAQGRSDWEASPVTRQFLAFAAALLVNAALLGTLQWSAYTARPVPDGQVIITQLDVAAAHVQLARN